MASGDRDPRQDPRDPLAQATAARLFSLIGRSKRRLSTAELARQAEVHSNSARLHLGRLHEAGLLDRSTVAGDRGRPHYEWSLSPRARVEGEHPVAYRELATWLSRSISRRGGDPGEIEAAGEQIGAEIAPMAGPGDPAQVLESALSTMGFEPRRRDRGAHTTFSLRNCPYREVAKADPGVVCTLHRGIARGLVRRVRPSTELTRFVIRNPDRAGCLIEIGRGSGVGA